MLSNRGLMNTKQRYIVAVTGASGSIYAIQLINELLSCDQVSEIAVIISERGAEVMTFEHCELMLSDPRITIYDNSDMFAPTASGSAHYNAMIIVPCSMGTVGRVACGVSGDLISRSADVMLKERRQLIMVVRESPFNTIHLRNMTTLSECGATILPASPSFYSHPSTIDQLCRSVTERIVSHLGLKLPHFEWGAEK